MALYLVALIGAAWLASGSQAEFSCGSTMKVTNLKGRGHFRAVSLDKGRSDDITRHSTFQPVFKWREYIVAKNV